MRFVAVGELLVDVLAEGRGHDARIRLRPAGSAFNAAVAAAAAGAEAAVVGRVGNDAAGRMILAELEERGVHRVVSVADGTTGTFLLADGDARVDRGVAHDLVLPERIEADAVLVSGYVPAAAEALARAQAPWVAFDAARLRELPPGGNAVFASEDWLGGRDPEREARRLAEGRRLACVTLGARGAIAVMGDRVERVSPERVAAGRPGAGDAFAATLLVALARGDDLADALFHASEAALDSLA
ncbi:MAG TPA: PfkB family carbohydrate kinase [Gaiellaceae bacterium]|nr:PfkB family carbohydrate kinase [Gaiellaceae bacterium]